MQLQILEKRVKRPFKSNLKRHDVGSDCMLSGGFKNDLRPQNRDDKLVLD